MRARKRHTRKLTTAMSFLKWLTHFTWVVVAVVVVVVVVRYTKYISTVADSYFWHCHFGIACTEFTVHSEIQVCTLAALTIVNERRVTLPTTPLKTTVQSERECTVMRNAKTYRHGSFLAWGTFVTDSTGIGCGWHDRRCTACSADTDSWRPSSANAGRSPCSPRTWWRRSGRPTICRRTLCTVWSRFELQIEKEREREEEDKTND